MSRGPKYNGLNDMLSKNDEAKNYFMTLPEYVQGMIRQRNDNIQTLDELYRYSDNITQGDK